MWILTPAHHFDCVYSPPHQPSDFLPWYFYLSPELTEFPNLLFKHSFLSMNSGFIGKELFIGKKTLWCL